MKKSNINENQPMIKMPAPGYLYSEPEAEDDGAWNAIDADWSATFSCALEEISHEIHETAKSKGWWDEDRNDGELIALIHSECSELLEWLRKGNNAESDHIKGFSGAEEEASDILIRLSDMAAARGWRLGEAVIAKMEYNKNREYKHGGKKF